MASPKGNIGSPKGLRRFRFPAEEGFWKGFKWTDFQSSSGGGGGGQGLRLPKGSRNATDALSDILGNVAVEGAPDVAQGIFGTGTDYSGITLDFSTIMGDGGVSSGAGAGQSLSAIAAAGPESLGYAAGTEGAELAATSYYGSGASGVGASGEGAGSALTGISTSTIVAAVIAAQMMATGDTDTVVEGQPTGNVFSGLAEGSWDPAFATEPWFAWLSDKLGWEPTAGEEFDAAFRNEDWGKVFSRLPAAADYWADPIRSWLDAGVTNLLGGPDSTLGKIGSWVVNPVGNLAKKIKKWF